jgi:hypothetical protein
MTLTGSMTEHSEPPEKSRGTDLFLEVKCDYFDILKLNFEGCEGLTSRYPNAYPGEVLLQG